MEQTLTKEQTLAIIRECGTEKENVLHILHELQQAAHSNHIDPETAALVAQELGFTETKLFEILTFYAMPKTEPQAKYVLKVCSSAPCYFSGGNTLVETLEQELGIPMGETTADGLFAFEPVPCFGACEIGPAFKVRDTVYGNLTPEKIRQILDDFRAGKREQ